MLDLRGRLAHFGRLKVKETDLMRRKFRWMRPGTLAAAAVSLVALGDPAAAATLETARIANWTAVAHASDQTGEFSHCSMSVAYQSGTTLRFAIDRRYDWAMALLNPAWQLPPGQMARVNLVIDEFEPVVATAKAVSPTMMAIQLKDDSGLFDLFRRGLLLRIGIGRDSYNFRLDGTAEGLFELVDEPERALVRRPVGQQPLEQRRRLGARAHRSQQPGLTDRRPRLDEVGADPRGEQRRLAAARPADHGEEGSPLEMIAGDLPVAVAPGEPLALLTAERLDPRVRAHVAGGSGPRRRVTRRCPVVGDDTEPLDDDVASGGDRPGDRHVAADRDGAGLVDRDRAGRRGGVVVVAHGSLRDRDDDVGRRPGDVLRAG